MNRSYALLTTQEYQDYFAQVTAAATFLDNFFYTYEELIQAGRVDRVGTVLVLEPYTNPISGHENDNIQARRKGMFVIARSITGPEQLPVAHEECERLCYKVIGRMHRDARARTLIAEITDWSGSPTSMLTGANYAGYAMEFSFYAPVNRFMAFDEDDWTETP